MSMRGKVLVPALAMGMALGAAGVGAQVPQRAGQQQRIQDRIHQVDQMVGRMDRIRDRIHQLDQTCVQDMDRIRDRIHDQDRLRDQVQDPDRLRDQDRLRQMERIRDATDAMGQMGQQMRTTMVQMRQMLGDPAFQGEPNTEQEMEQLQQHLQNMGDQLEEGIKVMEQLHQRVREGQPTR